MLFRSGGFGSVRTRAVKEKLTQRPLLMQDSSWRHIVAATGMPAVRAENAAQLEQVLKAWRWQDGPAYVEVPFDPEAYQQMVENLR